MKKISIIALGIILLIGFIIIMQPNGNTTQTKPSISGTLVKGYRAAGSTFG